MPRLTESQAEDSAHPVTDDTAEDNTIDDLDLRIIVCVHGYRKDHGTGPTWSEVRAQVGLPYVNYGKVAFKKWRASRSSDQPKGQWAFDEYVYQIDPLARRLFKLRRLGFLTFTRAERSLDVVKAQTTGGQS